MRDFCNIVSQVLLDWLIVSGVPGTKTLRRMRAMETQEGHCTTKKTGLITLLALYRLVLDVLPKIQPFIRGSHIISAGLSQSFGRIEFNFYTELFIFFLS